LWIDQASFVALKIEAYDGGDKLLKQMTASDVRLMDATRNRYQPMHLVAENVQTAHKTDIRFTEFKANVGIAAKGLTVEALESRQ
jgi:outer membrane lipoprotein-sorting protein